MKVWIWCETCPPTQITKPRCCSNGPESQLTYSIPHPTRRAVNNPRSWIFLKLDKGPPRLFSDEDLVSHRRTVHMVNLAAFLSPIGQYIKNNLLWKILAVRYLWKGSSMRDPQWGIQNQLLPEGSSMRDPVRVQWMPIKRIAYSQIRN
jgi:hypothetical protein